MNKLINIRNINIRKISKPLALIVAALMIVTLVPVTFLFAAAHDEGMDNNVGQIVYSGGALSYDEDGTPTDGNGVVSVSKTIAATGNENEFDITLEVKTTEDVTKMEFTPDTAVVLTIDISGSMAYNAAGNSTNDAAARRMNIAKDAAKAFIDDYAAGANGASRYISVVVFGLTAKVIQDWVDVGSNPANASAVKAQIDKIKDSTAASAGNYPLENGTFMQGGLLVSRNLYNKELYNGPASVDNRFVVLLTDGNPNCWITSTASINNYEAKSYTQSSGATENETGWRNARPYVTSVANQLRAGTDATASAKVYTIAYNTGSTVISGTTATNGLSNDGTADNWLRNRIAYNNTFAFTSTNNLSEIFETISTNISRWAEAWTVKDPMGANIRYAGGADAQSEPVSYENGALNWNLKEDGSAKVANGVTTFTYTYRVKLDTLAAGFTAGESYATNGRTTLTYSINVAEDDNDPIMLGSPITVDFEIPEVKGYADGLTFTKVGQYTGDHLEGYEFDLTIGGAVIRTARSDSNGTVTFHSVPSGHSYVLTERAATNHYPLLYNTSAETYDVTVAYGALTSAIQGGSFENPAKQVEVTLHKFFCNPDESFMEYIRFSSIQTTVCGIEEHTHDANCWSRTDSEVATPSSLPGEGDGWSLDCEKAEHAHEGLCFEYELVEDDDAVFTFTFTLTDKDGNAVDSKSITLTKNEILALMESGEFYTYEDGSPISFTVPAAEIGNGPFAITETSAGEYTGWTLSDAAENIILGRRTAPVVEMDNNFGGIRRPVITVTKDLLELRGNTDNTTFGFELYDGATLVREITIDVNQRNSRTVRLNEYLNANATLTLIEKIPADMAPGMDYDTTVYTIEIADGRVVSINDVETNNAVFTNRYYETVTPEFGIHKDTNGNHNGTFTFSYSWEGSSWDGFAMEGEEEARTPVSGSGTVNINTAAGRDATVELEELANFTGSIVITENRGTDPNWKYDAKQVVLHFENGEFLYKEVYSNDVEQSAEEDSGATAYFYNEYSYTPPSEPDPVYTPEVTVTVDDEPSPSPAAEEEAEAVVVEEVVLAEEEVPMAEFEPEPEIEEEVIIDEAPPLSEMPQTGIEGTAGLWAFALSLALMGAVVLAVVVKTSCKKED